VRARAVRSPAGRDGLGGRERALSPRPPGRGRAVTHATRVPLRAMSRPRLVCLVGPPAPGKRAPPLELAQALDAEIVSADSRQIYRALDVGTAKPTAAERRLVPH